MVCPLEFSTAASPRFLLPWYEGRIRRARGENALCIAARLDMIQRPFLAGQFAHIAVPIRPLNKSFHGINSPQDQGNLRRPGQGGAPIGTERDTELHAGM